MQDRFYPAMAPAGVPQILRKQYVSSPGAGFILGAVLVYSSGEVDVGGTNPTAIVGTALAAPNSYPGYNSANSPSQTTWRQRWIPVAIADRRTIFYGKLTNNSSTRIAPVQADVGAEYGITAYSNIWTVDKNKTSTNARVEIVNIDLLNNGVFFKFLEAHIAAP